MNESPYQDPKINPAGFWGLVLFLFVLFGVCTLFPTKDSTIIFGTIALVGILFAVVLRFYFNRRSKSEQLSLFESPNDSQTSALEARLEREQSKIGK